LDGQPLRLIAIRPVGQSCVSPCAIFCGPDRGNHRDEGDFEAFVDAIPGYLRQNDHDIGISEFNEGIRIDNIYIGSRATARSVAARRSACSEGVMSPGMIT